MLPALPVMPPPAPAPAAPGEPGEPPPQDAVQQPVAATHSTSARPKLFSFVITAAAAWSS
jgi:hypothetical protein